MITEQGSSESARDYALRVLKQAIIDMELKPGQLLSENELSAKLGISRTPVREALRELEKNHIIEILPQRGNRVALIDYEQVEEARFAREVLETAILPLVCERATLSEMNELRQNLYLQRLSQEPGSGAPELITLDNEFHRMLFKIARKMTTYEMLQSMMIHFDRVRTLSIRVVHDSHVIDDHALILEAISRRDALAAQAAMSRHLNRVKVDEQTIRKSCPEYIKP